MSGIAPEDRKTIAHIEFVCDEIHDFANELYEGLMDREYDASKEKAQELIQVLADLIQSLTDEI